MSEMPIVTEDVIKTIVRDLESQYDEKNQVETLNHLVDFWRDFKVEQPALSALLLKKEFPRA